MSKRVDNFDEWKKEISKSPDEWYKLIMDRIRQGKMVTIHDLVDIDPDLDFGYQLIAERIQEEAIEKSILVLAKHKIILLGEGDRVDADYPDEMYDDPRQYVALPDDFNIGTFCAIDADGNEWDVVLVPYYKIEWLFKTERFFDLDENTA
ncbi:MAG: hypothetical protein WAV05_10205 [Anaerolineales bacterium]